MGALIEVILPVFAVIGLGWLAARTGFLEIDVNRALSRYAQVVAIPALLFLGVARLDIGANFDPLLLLGYYSGSLLLFLVGAGGAVLLFRRPVADGIAIGFAAMFANSVMLGLPVTERAFGADALGPNLAIVAVHAPFCYFFGITAMEIARGAGSGLRLATARRVLKAMFSNAIMVGLALGFAVNLTGLPLPGMATSALDLIARSALPVALFSLGMTISQYRIEGDLRVVIWIGVLSLGLHPLIAWTLTDEAFGLPHELVRSAVLTAAMAPGINAYLFATMYGVAQRVAATAVLLLTTASIVTASLWLALVG